MAEPQQDDTPSEAAPAPGKRRRLLLAGAGVLALLLVAGGTFAFLHARGGSGKPAAAVARTPLFYALDPPFVVNFQGEGQVRFLQVGLQLMAYDQGALDTAKAEDPVIRNDLVMLFSGQDQKALMTRAGKEKLRADALADVQRIVHARDHDHSIQALYFTSFVMQ